MIERRYVSTAICCNLIARLMVVAGLPGLRAEQVIRGMGVILGVDALALQSDQLGH